ncbi:hypothetical protein DOM21_03675 [Bacteriovorax stolpii]|uniref:hypothetical protein n=1 Tax=Bacteriovorax stolpii TaxID=960 RepID=UPI0011582504|nr:hypothetical protein [Bacteriovorax stolpii]QDK40565.1 hypothetical protein DOM21_03675 [Bacteriovorax stolpii]
MEANLTRSLAGKIWLVFLAITWGLVLIVIPYDLILRNKANLYGLPIMLLGFLLLVFSKRKYLFQKEYWYKFGFSHLKNNERNLYFLSYLLLYVGFVVTLL